MCISCMTSLEAYVWSGAGVVAAASTAVQRRRDRARGRTAGQRRADHYDRAATFVESMGHDAGAVLGPRPSG